MEKEIRKCSCCGKEITSAYVLDDGTYYFCSEKCLNSQITMEEYEEMYDEGLAYWTEF